jgi:hypothetical protein
MTQNALWIVRQAQAELGLPQSSDISASANALDMQFCALLNSAGNELQQYYPWQGLTGPFSFSTQAGKASYSLPTDYSYFIDQTQWANNDVMQGPKSAQEWQFLKNSIGAAMGGIRYRVFQGLFWLMPTPGSVYTVSMEYVSKNWVNAGLSNATTLVSTNADVPLFDEWLLVKFVKLKFWETKGFDTTAFRDDFVNAFNAKTGKNMGAPVLSMVPRRSDGYLGPWNVPDGSWHV